MIFIHGLHDNVVPLRSTQNLVKAIEEAMPTIKCQECYPSVDHAEAVTDLMLGRETTKTL